MSATLAPDPETVSPNIAKKIAAYPPHVQAGLQAYRAALSRRNDWHKAVIAAIDAAEKVKDTP